jgi:hypothetical protein
MGIRIHPTLFDVKGVGGGGYVVAPGSIRANGEVYTVIDDLPVTDVPNFLVDWLASRLRKNSIRSGCSTTKLSCFHSTTW